MQTFRNILFVSRQPTEESDAVEEALRIAHRSGAKITMVHACPQPRKAMAPYRDALLRSIREDLHASIDRACEAVGLDRGALAIDGHVVVADAPVVHVVQRVLRDAHDLVVKKAETGDAQAGLRSFDMHLLRKCPSPVWLCRRGSGGHARVGVAVDPESHEPADRELASRLLVLASQISNARGGEAEVLSCWDFEFESFLRSNPLAKIPTDEVSRIVAAAKAEHRQRLDALIKASGMGGSPRIHHIRGQPSRVLPAHLDALGIDLLVMGTVARTGIPGYLIGNTAENILQKIRCSILALKPDGFVSPMRAS
jgi:universal stress protein E